MSNAGLMYIDHRDRVAYFCQPGTTGREWDGTYRSWNAGAPESWEHRVLFWAPEVDLAADKLSVDSINSSGGAWLRYGSRNRLKAHASVDEFRQFITAAGGQSFVMDEING